MPDIWAELSKQRLQNLIGENILGRLETLLPALSPDELDVNQIYTKDSLSKIFNAFSGPAALDKNDFRKELFNSLPPDRLNKIILATNVGSLNDDFTTKVDKLVRKGWQKDPLFAASVAKELGLSEDFLPQELILPALEQVVGPTDKPYKPLKDYQSPTYYEAINRLGLERSRFVVQMPTGSGKTRTAMEIICSFLNQASTGTVVLWLVHSEELCEQAYDCFSEVWPHLAQREVRIIRCWGSGSRLPYEFPESAFIIGGFPKLHSSLQSNPIPFQELKQRMGLIVIDEAHRLLAPTYEEVTRAFLGESSRVMGLTATPGRSTVDDEENKALAKFFFNEIIEIHSDGMPVIEYLRRKNVLAHSAYEPLITDRSYALNPSERAFLERYFRIPDGLLQRMGADDLRNVEIVKVLERECKNHSQILFFACSVEHSKFICALLIFLGFSAAHLDGTVPRARRNSIVKNFKSTKIQVLCNYEVLSTGFDAPKTDVIFISRPTGSIVLYSQMIGRGLRGPAIGGTEQCKIIDVRDNIEGFPNEIQMYEHFAEYYK